MSQPWRRIATAGNSAVLVLLVLLMAVVAYAVGGIALLVGYGLLLVLGIGLRTAWPIPRVTAFSMGLACAFISVALARLLGKTVSLSALDVRVVFHLLESPGGVPAAVGQALPAAWLLTVRGTNPVLGSLGSRSASPDLL